MRQRAGPTTVGGGVLEIATPMGPLFGDFVMPRGDVGIVAFAHGSGSSRHSPRNRAVAKALQDVGLGTFLVDLLTGPEGERDERTAELRFDIPLLGERTVTIVDAFASDERVAGHAIGVFGASTGAAAALLAAAERPELVHAVVSRGGRPDLAGTALARVRAPTLFIVGAADTEVLALNRDAFAQMTAPIRRIAIVESATHLFDEPGALEEVAALAGAWFVRYLKRSVPL